MSPLYPPYPIIRRSLENGETIPFLGSGASLKCASMPCAVWEQCVVRKTPGSGSGEGGSENKPAGETGEKSEDADYVAAGEGAAAEPAGNGAHGCYLKPAHCAGLTPTHTGRFSAPRADELACYLARQTNFPSDEMPDLTKVAQYYDVVGGRGRLERDLHDIFNKDYPFTSLHTRLAAVEAPLLIVTTNYDDLLERAFRKAGRPFDVVIHTNNPPKLGHNILWWQHGSSQPVFTVPNKLGVDPLKTTVIYKMHGAVDRDDHTRDQYVITEDDYIEFLTRMTRKGHVIPAPFTEPFQTRSFLFLGHGLRDWNLRVVLNGIEKEMKLTKRIASWAVQHRPSALERRFWQNRNVEVYDMELETFVNNL